MEHEVKKGGLPHNAYTELAPGERYVPVVPHDRPVAEITARSVVLGVVMAVVFSFSAAYLGLKVGQVFEAAIPIAILAVGFSVLFKRRSTILENVIVQSIGAASGVVVAGGIFVIPALYILGLKPSLLDTFLAALLGGCLGILFLIPLRKFFVAEQHGKLPFPEATATTEILVTGESGGSQARVLVRSMIIGGLFDFLADAMHAWNFHLNSFDSVRHTKALFGSLGSAMYDKFRMVFRLDALTAFIGLGYIVGLKYSAIIAAGSILSFLVLVPLVFFFGSHIQEIIPPGTKLISAMTEGEIFKAYVQKIGIGAIAAAGIIGIIKSSRIITGAFGLGFKEIFSGKSVAGEAERTQKDLSMKSILMIIGAVLLAVLAFFIIKAGTAVGVTGLIIVFVLAFLFTTVAAYAIAIVGTNPVSGMTLITLIITSLVLSNILPLEKEESRVAGMTIALIMGCVVCTALSMAGGFITDLKIGYWLGSTPRNQERFKFLGTVVAAASVSFAILLIEMAYGFTVKDATGAITPNPDVPAPQGNLMATIIQSLMDPTQIQPWLLYGVGALIAVVLEMSKIPPLAFALGMYLPIELNTPLLAGGFLSWLVGKSTKDKELSGLRREKGTLIASGFIAGGALMGMIGAIMNLDQIGKPIEFLSIGTRPEIAGFFSNYGQFIGLLMFAFVMAYVYFDSIKTDNNR
ncbi:MAG: oligopeptide transporter, OPT family [Deltaproteobacteria bacterium]|nr:oligopeptide transporter, OPT family [Deltaproteobacteria bacterium]